jgi:hypothetical protein
MAPRVCSFISGDIANLGIRAGRSRSRRQSSGRQVVSISESSMTSSIDKMFAELIAQRLVLQALVQENADRSPDMGEFLCKLRSRIRVELDDLELLGHDELRKHAVRREIEKAYAAIVGHQTG